MMRFILHLSLILALLPLAQALPPATDLSAREKRNIAPRATRANPSPTPAEETGETAAPATRQSTTVVVDAGHGGFDRGGIPGQRVPESAMTLNVAQRVKRLLEAGGYRVVMTRNSDVFIPLGTRAAIANSYRNAIFVSIHFNSANRRGADGIETYFYSRESLALASAIHYNVVAATPTPNRGVRRRGFFVLRRTTIPSVLVECGFLTNPSEAQAAQSSAYQDKLAQAIVRGIRSRGSVASNSSARAATADAVPLQPFIDQTRMRNRDVGKSKRVSKKSKSSKSKKSSSSESSKKKKKTSSPAPEN